MERKGRRKGRRGQWRECGRKGSGIRGHKRKEIWRAGKMRDE